MRRLKLQLPSCQRPSVRAHEGFRVPADWVWATIISVSIPRKADTYSDSYRTLIRRYRTVVGAKLRFSGSDDSTRRALARAARAGGVGPAYLPKWAAWVRRMPG